MANIFCVEDDTGIRELITCALQSGGYTAEGFPDGKSFFHRLRDDKPALILLDIMLPDEDGISILKRLKGNDATAEIPVIMLSAKSSEIDKVTGLENGADDYITKPFGIMELLSRIKAVLRRSHTVQKAESHVLSAHDLTIDLDQRTVVSPIRNSNCCPIWCATVALPFPGTAFWNRSGDSPMRARHAPWMHT